MYVVFIFQPHLKGKICGETLVVWERTGRVGYCWEQLYGTEQEIKRMYCNLSCGTSKGAPVKTETTHLHTIQDSKVRRLESFCYPTGQRYEEDGKLDGKTVFKTYKYWDVLIASRSLLGTRTKRREGGGEGDEEKKRIWDFRLPRSSQHWLAVGCRYFGTAYRFHFQGPCCPRQPGILTFEDEKMALPRNVGDYQSALCNIPEERRPQFIRCLHTDCTCRIVVPCK